MCIHRLRVHVAVTDGGQCLHAEEESSPVPAGIEVGNVRRLNLVDRRKDEIEKREEAGVAQEELRPADGHEEMIEVLPGAARQAVGQYRAVAGGAAAYR